MIACAAIAPSLSRRLSLSESPLALTLSNIWLIVALFIGAIALSLLSLSCSLSGSSAGHGEGATQIEQLIIVAGINPQEILQYSTETDDR